MDQSGKILIAMFLGLLAVAFTGDQSVGVGFSKECIDGINNDGVNDGIDYWDNNCLDYPYADGLGETFTQIGADYQAEKYAYSLWDYHYLYGGQGDTYWCQQTSYDSWTVTFDAIQTYSNDKDTAYDDYVYWFAQNCP